MADLIVLTGADLQPENVEWLWPGWLARGKFVILAGNAGTGKSTVMLDLCARISQGKQWPDGTATSGPESCLVWDGEDDVANTLVPRFLGAGGDPARMGFVRGFDIAGETVYFDPANEDHFNKLLAYVKKHRPAFVGISPLAQLVVSKSNDLNAGIRRDLNRLVNLADKYNVAILGIHHLSKGTQGRDPLERLSGSLAFGALARGAWVSVMDEAHSQRRMVRVKVTNGIEGGAMAYTLEPRQFMWDSKRIETSGVAWGDFLEGSPGKLIRELERTEKDEDKVVKRGEKVFHDACELLLEGPMPAKELKERLIGMGHRAYAVEHCAGPGLIRGRMWDLEPETRRRMNWIVESLRQ